MMPRATMPPALSECSTPLATRMAQLLIAHRLHSKAVPNRVAGTVDTYVCDTCGIEQVQEWTHGGLATYQLRHQAEQIAAWITAQGVEQADANALAFSRMTPEQVAAVLGGEQLQLWD